MPRTISIDSVFSLRDLFPKYRSIFCVLLFGSAAMGNATPLSDIDLSYLSTPEPGCEEESSIAEEIRKRLRTDDVDFVSFFRLPIRVRHGMLSTGKILYLSDEEKFCDAKEATIREYLDFKHCIDEYDRCFRERMARGILFQ